MRNLILLVLAVMIGIALLGWVVLKLAGLKWAIVAIVVALVVVGGLTWLFFRNLTID